MYRKTGLLLILVALLAIPVQAQQNNKLLVAAASDLRFALDSVVEVFNKKEGTLVDVVYGSSGKLYEQISNSAPFHVFFSADIEYPLRLQENGFTVSEIYPYGIGRLALWSKKSDPNLEKMETLLASSIKKIAIANPQHAPYGQRAVESMEYYQLYDKVKNSLVFGENISQTAQFVTSGAADIGIVALSLAVSPNMKKENGSYYLIPEESHQPLIQGAVITSHGKDNMLAVRFMDFVKSDTANAILQHFGFTKPAME